MRTTLDPADLDLPDVFAYFLPAAAVAILLEWLWLTHRRRERYRGAEVGRNVVLWLGYEGLTWLTGGMFIFLGLWCYDHRIHTFDLSLASFLVLFFAEDFVMYATHVMKHKCRFFWAADHEVHHSSPEFNFTTAFRNSPLALLSGSWLPWPMLCLLGFPPAMVFFQASLSRAYQCFTHTQTIRRLPAPIEWIFVTPSHHRVHHAKNDLYIDKNYGGILILWDRMFGTFQAERDDVPCEFGVLTPFDTTRVGQVLLHGMRSMLDAVRRRHGLKAKLATLVLPPDWAPTPARRQESAPAAAPPVAGVG